MSKISVITTVNGERFTATLIDEGGIYYRIRSDSKAAVRFEIRSEEGKRVYGRIKDGQAYGECPFFGEFQLTLFVGDKEVKARSESYVERANMLRFTYEEKEPEKPQTEPEIPVEIAKRPPVIKESADGQIEETEGELGFEGEVASVNYFESVASAEASVNATEFLKEKREERSKQAFYLKLKPELDNLFTAFPPDEYLSEVIPSSKWVKISYDGNGKSYSVGVITDSEEVVYIGYGVRADFSDDPPREVKSIAQWMPLDFENIKGEGYWMIYQSATDGSNV